MLLITLSICVLHGHLAAAAPLLAAPLLATNLHHKRQSEPSVTSSAVRPGMTDRSGWRASFSQQSSEEPSPMLSIVTIALIVAMVVILLLARFIWVIRHYPLSFRAFFVPPHGVDFFGIQIRAATPRPPKGPPPAYRGPPIRGRRGVPVRGEDIGEGGARLGERDEDDTWDNEQGGAAPKESLPTYAVDHSLPGYVAGAQDSNLTPQTSREEALPSAQAYEAATRRAPSRANSASAPALEMQQVVPSHQPLTRLDTTESTSSGSSSATRVDDAEQLTKTGKVEEQQIEHAGESGDLGEMEMMTRSPDLVSVRRE